MGKIRNDGTVPPIGPKDVQQQPAKPAETTPATKPAAGTDRYERAATPQASAVINAPVPPQLKNITPQFSNADYAYLAQQFAAVILKQPNANRAERARLISAIILKHSRLRKLLAGDLSEAQVEEMAGAIGDVLSDSPLFGDLIDKVTAGAHKLNAGG